ncbi:MAG TPA: hypothetical protein VI756_07655 [Blastocatellia bacterium]
MKHILWVVGLVALVLGIMNWRWEETNRIVMSVVLFLISLVLLAIFFFKTFRDEGKQDISITKF